MESLLRPLIYLGLGLLLGVGGHAAFQSATAPAKENAEVASAASVSQASAPDRIRSGARPLGQSSEPELVGKSVAFHNGRQDGNLQGAALLAKLQALPEGQEGEDYLRGVFTALASGPPEDAMNLALQLDDPRLQSMAVKTLALEWAFAPGTLANEGTLANAMFGAVVALASTNPAKAALFAQTNLEGRSQQFAMMAVGKQWAQVDPEGALAWMGSMAQSEDNTRLAASVAMNVARTDPQLAAGYLDRIPDDRSRQWTASQLAESWFQKDAKAAVDWATNLADPAVKERALRSVASEWAQKDPQAAAQWAQSLGDETAARTAVSGVAREWARADPQAAVKYASALPAGDTRTSVLRNVASGWSRVDGDAAKAWAQSLPVEAERASALQGLRGGGRFGGR